MVPYSRDRSDCTWDCIDLREALLNVPGQRLQVIHDVLDAITPRRYSGWRMAYTALAFQNDSIRVSIDLRAYCLIAVKKAGYAVAEKCTLVIGVPDGDELPLTFSFKPGTPEQMAREAVRLFFQEVLDYELREAIAGETAPLRALILAQAFSKTDLVQRE